MPTFEYTGAIQQVNLPPGKYKIECWGAQGGYCAAGREGLGGKGGYAVGTIVLTSPTMVYIFVGGCPGLSLAGGWNGGGNGVYAGYAAGGGGASDVRIGGNDFTDRVIVAGGGGGNEEGKVGGDGGGLTGISGNGGTGGSQTFGGLNGGSFGKGGNGGITATSGGGGGWYGGGAGRGYFQSGGGGSSYIGGILSGVDMDGVDDAEQFPKMPIIDGYTATGVREGHGLVIITEIFAETIDIEVAMVCDNDVAGKKVELSLDYFTHADGDDLSDIEPLTITKIVDVPETPFERFSVIFDLDMNEFPDKPQFNCRLVRNEHEDAPDNDPVIISVVQNKRFWE